MKTNRPLHLNNCYLHVKSTSTSSIFPSKLPHLCAERNDAKMKIPFRRNDEQKISNTTRRSWNSIILIYRVNQRMSEDLNKYQLLRTRITASDDGRFLVSGYWLNVMSIPFIAPVGSRTKRKEANTSLRKWIVFLRHAALPRETQTRRKSRRRRCVSWHLYNVCRSIQHEIPPLRYYARTMKSTSYDESMNSFQTLIWP